MMQFGGHYLALNVSMVGRYCLVASRCGRARAGDPITLSDDLSTLSARH
jgi:hypothetical protein